MAVARRTLSALCALWLAACAAPPVHPPSPPIAPARLDPRSDWHRLPIAAFGSALQDLRVPVHEVLMFGELASQECYGLDGPQGQFIGHPISAYLLCYAHSRLDRIEVTVALTGADAAAQLSRYCDAWQPGTSGFVRSATGCSGTAGDSFNASLLEAEEAGQDGAQLSIVVSDAPVPDSP